MNLAPRPHHTDSLAIPRLSCPGILGETQSIWEGQRGPRIAAGQQRCHRAPLHPEEARLPGASLTGQLILSNPHWEGQPGRLSYSYDLRVLYIACFIFKPVNRFLKRLHIWAEIWAAQRRSHRQGGENSHPRPGGPGQETMGFPFSWIFSNQNKNEANLLTPWPLLVRLETGYKFEMDHTLTELYLSSFLIKPKAQGPQGVNFFSFWQRQKPATMGLLLLSCCQVGDSVKIGTASHLFTGTRGVAICTGAQLVWPWLLLNFFFPQDCSKDLKEDTLPYHQRCHLLARLVPPRTIT